MKINYSTKKRISDTDYNSWKEGDVVFAHIPVDETDEGTFEKMDVNQGDRFIVKDISLDPNHDNPFNQFTFDIGDDENNVSMHSFIKYKYED